MTTNLHGLLYYVFFYPIWHFSINLATLIEHKHLDFTLLTFITSSLILMPLITRTIGGVFFCLGYYSQKQYSYPFLNCFPCICLTSVMALSIKYLYSYFY